MEWACSKVYAQKTELRLEGGKTKEEETKFGSSQAKRNSIILL